MKIDDLDAPSVVFVSRAFPSVNTKGPLRHLTRETHKAPPERSDVFAISRPAFLPENIVSPFLPNSSNERRTKQRVAEQTPNIAQVHALHQLPDAEQTRHFAPESTRRRPLCRLTELQQSKQAPMLEIWMSLSRCSRLRRLGHAQLVLVLQT